MGVPNQTFTRHFQPFSAPKIKPNQKQPHLPNLFKDGTICQWQKAFFFPDHDLLQLCKIKVRSNSYSGISDAGKMEKVEKTHVFSWPFTYGQRDRINKPNKRSEAENQPISNEESQEEVDEIFHEIQEYGIDGCSCAILCVVLSAGVCRRRQGTCNNPLSMGGRY